MKGPPRPGEVPRQSILTSQVDRDTRNVTVSSRRLVPLISAQRTRGPYCSGVAGGILEVRLRRSLMVMPSRVHRFKRRSRGGRTAERVVPTVGRPRRSVPQVGVLGCFSQVFFSRSLASVKAWVIFALATFAQRHHLPYWVGQVGDMGWRLSTSQGMRT